jgi:hypothetical protein
MNLPPRMPNLPPSIQEEVEQQRNYAFELGNKLIESSANERNTYVIHKEVGIINVLQIFADMQDIFRKKYAEIDTPCALSLVLSHNLALRSSMLGWRSKQLVEILQSPKIEQNTNMSLMPDANKGQIKRI